MSKSTASIKEKNSLPLQQRDEGESELEQTDDITDDSASSYYTALCSLSEYSEALGDRTHTLSTDRPAEGGTFEFLGCATTTEGITSRSLITDTTISQDYKTQEEKGTEVLPDESQCEQDESSSSESVLESESKHLQSGTTAANVDLQSVKAAFRNPLQKPDNSNKLNLSGKDSSVKPRDYFGGSRTVFHTNIRTAEEHSSPEPKLILITPRRNQYSKGREQEHGSTEPKEDHATQKQRPKECLSAPRAECRLERGRHILCHMKKEGEGQGSGVSCRMEQVELSVRSRNRKVSANCISTLTASKQESRIPPHCYSERIPATRHQHQLQRLADTRTLEKQSRQGVWQSRPLYCTLCSSTWQPCHTTGNSRGSTSMGTKLAEASSKVGGLVNLAQVRASCSETDYMHVFRCRPSSQPSADENHNNWTDDVLSFKMQMYSNTQNTSACSESSSFECVDVALETTDEVNRGLKTVPKRQIQLKRRDTTEAHAKESNNQSLQVANTPVRARDTFQRQHSTPAAFNQESHVADQRSVQAVRKHRLQKSFSLDETSSKTQMASCIITNVLSKKMQHEQNLRTLDVSDKAFASIKVNNRTITTDECIYLSGKDVFAETTKLNQSATLKRETQRECSPVQKHCSVNSKMQPKLLSKHGFNPLLSAIGRSEVQGSGTEITDPSENEKAEKLSPREDMLRLPNLSPGVKLSCDSAKRRAWNSSPATNVAISTQASMKTTPEECHTGQGIHKQRNMTLTNVLEKQEQQAGIMESTLSSTNIAWLISDLEANVVDNRMPQADESNVGKEQESGREEVKSRGQSAILGMQSQGKLKAMAPVHVVRDMRTLVKNTYNMSFKGTGESAHGIDGSAPLFQPSMHNLSNSMGEGKGKGYRQDKKPLVQKVTPPLSLDRRRDHSAPRGCLTKVMPPVESNGKSHTVGFTKVSQISVTKANSCALSKPSETQDSQVGMGKPDVPVSDTNLKPTNRTDLALQAKKEASTEKPTKEDLNKAEHEMTISSDKDILFPVALQYCPPTASSEQRDHGKIISDGLQTPCLPPRSQSSVGPLSACILTLASTPMVPSYYYKPNPLGYQTISPHIGAIHGYVQGPVLFQTSLYNQPSASNSHTPLLRSLYEDGKMLVHPTDGSTSQSQNGEAGLKMSSPESQHNTNFVAPMNAEARLGGTGMLYPETGGSVAAAQNPRQLLLDPETGCYFYVDMPQLPQRKMLFDPETCQYVEVLLPQQTLPSAVLPTPCAISFASVHIPPMYTPQCLPYVQSHPQVLPPPEP
ncbi:uncharacterized protein [Sinocyclocheilus grahami]|uniref:uncharacterized protein n=1 Tax=Sinocyclocheilus grahami TaxID=75366 RepID=UPI0007ACD994|nr:PREDICTED: uncharacterized protein LOC107557040 [Sinocyclocheilus grahami]